MVSKLFPLDFFYRRAELKLPEHHFISGAEVPEPYRDLLVHEQDMTGTLQRFHQSKLHLQLLSLFKEKGEIYREVTLVKEDESPVEFGAIRIDLTHFPEEARAEIEAGYTPLGAILSERKVSFLSRPSRFFAVESDALINKALRLNGAFRLFGRVNKLRSPEQNILAEVVEILPPI